MEQLKIKSLQVLLRLDKALAQKAQVSGNQQRRLLEGYLKTMTLVLNLATTYPVSLLHRAIQEDRRVQTKVMYQVAQEDEGLLQEILEDHSNSLDDSVPLVGSHLVMVYHHRVDLSNLLDDSNHPHRDKATPTCSQGEIPRIPKGRTDNNVTLRNRSTEANLTLSSHHKGDIRLNSDRHIRGLLEVSPMEVLV